MEGKRSRWSSQPRPRDLLRKIKGRNSKPIQNHLLQVATICNCEFHALLNFWCPEFTRAIVEDLSNGRSPEILIDRFRNYCSNPSATWFDSKLTLSIFVPLFRLC